MQRLFILFGMALTLALVLIRLADPYPVRAAREGQAPRGVVGRGAVSRSSAFEVTVRRPVAILMVTGAWWMFLISPRNTQISDLETERNVAVDTEGRLRVQIQQLEEIRDGDLRDGQGAVDGEHRPRGDEAAHASLAVPA